MFQALKQMFARGEQTPLPAVPPELQGSTIRRDVPINFKLTEN